MGGVAEESAEGMLGCEEDDGEGLGGHVWEKMASMIGGGLKGF